MNVVIFRIKENDACTNVLDLAHWISKEPISGEIKASAEEILCRADVRVEIFRDEV